MLSSPQLSSIQAVGSGAGLRILPRRPAEGKEGTQFTFRRQRCRGLCLPLG